MLRPSMVMWASFKVGLELFIAQGPEILKAIRNFTDAGIFLDLKLHASLPLSSGPLWRQAFIGRSL